MVYNINSLNWLINSYSFYNVLILHIIKTDTYYHKVIYEKIIMFLFRSFTIFINNVNNNPNSQLILVNNVKLKYSIKTIT